ncbi:hypothetical protein P691DRAFT_260527 [Macrolepiota fuliginosa MF-IS2]|uniref:Uncharacterized protein n=1 Tax=Macrolepiota fuliginosa MF-IS2 TaxID=1400762 RepID=A0A9P5X6Z4_9AGAR|nr:hypothetical protein P691DRAFT_260527 [Macrolepiota fuliginosa MF-IS2]
MKPLGLHSVPYKLRFEGQLLPSDGLCNKKRCKMPDINTIGIPGRFPQQVSPPSSNRRTVIFSLLFWSLVADSPI